MPTTTESHVYYTPAETAKLVRAALKATFPATKFSVRTSVYAGGASVDVRWTDGPTAQRVNAVTREFEGCYFDSSQDMKYYIERWDSEGRKVSYGAHYIDVQRTVSDEHWHTVAALVADRYGVPAVPTRADAFHLWVDNGNNWFSHLVHRALEDRSLVC